MGYWVQHTTTCNDHHRHKLTSINLLYIGPN